MELNSDGFAQGVLGRAAAKGIIRDHRGTFVGAYFFNVSVGTAFIAKISTVIQGIICSSVQLA